VSYSLIYKITVRDIEKYSIAWLRISLKIIHSLIEI